MIKRLGIVILVLMMMVGFSCPTFALSTRYGLKTTTVETNTSAALPAGTWVYGIAIYADASSSWAAIYDDLALNSSNCSDGDRIDEIGEATQYDSQVRMYDKPIYATNAVSVIMTTGVLTIYYGPAP